MSRSVLHSRWLAAATTSLTIWLGGCDSATTAPSATPPTTTTPQTTTETYQGELNPNGARTFAFTLQAAGVVTATLTALGAESTVAIGLSLGTWNGTACQIVLANDNAVQGTTVTGTAASAGNLCVRVYDAVGNLTANVAFTVTVVHP